MQLTVVLGINQETSFDIKLHSTQFVKKWINELDWCLKHCEINQQEAFAEFMPIGENAKKLTFACEIINKYLKNFIVIKPDILDQPQEYFNYLHEKFEQLSGEFGKPTKLFSLANHELKSAIRDLNFYIHSVEKKISANKLYLSFDKNTYRRHHLDHMDYDNFAFDMNPGDLLLHYVELGKSYKDIWTDGLPLAYRGTKNLHFYSGEATLHFKKINVMPADFKTWLTNANIDPYDKTLGHGKICLGKIENLEETFKKITSFKHINKIIIKD